MARGKETVRIIRRPKVDKLKPAAGPTQEFDIEGCDVLPRIAREAEGSYVQVSGFTIIKRGAADIHEDDEVLVRGEVHSVIGKPGVYGPPSRPKATMATTERVG